jgi:hypothetical protein
MRIETRPSHADPKPWVSRRLLWEIVVADGFALTALGINEIGGLLNLALGLVAVFAGSIPLILDAHRSEESFEYEVSRLLDEG